MINWSLSVFPFMEQLTISARGFCRLAMCPSKSYPHIIIYVNINYISSLKWVSETIKEDRSSEIFVVVDMQLYIREEHQDSMSGYSSFYLEILQMSKEIFGGQFSNEKIASAELVFSNICKMKVCLDRVLIIIKNTSIFVSH